MCKDLGLQDMIVFLREPKLPQVEERARRIALQGHFFFFVGRGSPLFLTTLLLVENVLYFLDSKRENRKYAVVPKSL